MHTTIHKACAAEGSCVVSEGSSDPRVVLPRVLAALAQLSPEAHQQLTAPGCGFAAVPAHAMEDESSEWWNGADAAVVLLALTEALNEAAPEGFFFGVEGDMRCGFFRLYVPADGESEAAGFGRSLDDTALQSQRRMVRRGRG